MWCIADAHVASADRPDKARAEIGIDLVAPAKRPQGGEAFGDETLPGLGGIAAAEDEHQPAFFGLSRGHPHLHQAVLADCVLRCCLTCPLTPGENRAALGGDADELAVV